MGRKNKKNSQKATSSVNQNVQLPSHSSDDKKMSSDLLEKESICQSRANDHKHDKAILIKTQILRSTMSVEDYIKENEQLKKENKKLRELLQEKDNKIIKLETIVIEKLIIENEQLRKENTELQKRVDDLVNDVKFLKKELDDLKKSKNYELYSRHVADLMNKFYEAFIWNYLKNSTNRDPFMEEFFKIIKNNKTGIEVVQLKDKFYKSLKDEQKTAKNSSGYDPSDPSTKDDYINELKIRDLHKRIFEFIKSKSGSENFFIECTEIKAERNNNSHIFIPGYNAHDFISKIKEIDNNFNFEGFAANQECAIKDLFKILLS